MTSLQWKTGRDREGLTQVQASQALRVSQPYLSQLEKGLRLSSAGLARKAARLYRLGPTALPLPEDLKAPEYEPGELYNRLAGLGYPGFEHVRSKVVSNPAEVVLSALARP